MNTASDDGVQAAEQAEDLQEQELEVVRAVQQYVAGMRVEDRESLARDLSKALGLEMGELVPLTATGASFSTTRASLIGPATVTATASMTLAKPRIVADGDVATMIESASAMRPEDIGNLTARARRDGIAGFTDTQQYILILVLAIGLAAILPGLTAQGQAYAMADLDIATAAFTLMQAVKHRKR